MKKEKLPKEEEIFLKKEAHLKKVETIARNRGYKEEVLTEAHYNICHDVASQIRSTRFKFMAFGFMLLDTGLAAIGLFVVQEIMSVEGELISLLMFIKSFGASTLTSVVIATAITFFVAFLFVNRGVVKESILKISVLPYSEYLTLKEDLQEKTGTITDVDAKSEVLIIVLSKKELKKLAKTSDEEKGKKKDKKKKKKKN